MNLLLDTHVLIWAVMDVEKLSPTARFHILDPDNRVYVSSISLWEVAIKHSLGKLDLKGITPVKLASFAEEEIGIHLLDLDSHMAADCGNVPALHPDPFDRMLIHQARSLDYHMVSADQRFSAYEEHGLKLIW